MRQDADALLEYIRVHLPQNEPDLPDRTQHGAEEFKSIGRAVPAYSSDRDMYNWGTAVMHLHFGWSRRSIRWPGGQSGGDYCAILRKTSMTDAKVALGDELPPDVKIRSEVPNARTDDGKLSVLIRVVETIDDSEDSGIGPSSQLVRLHPYDECLYCRVHPLDGTPEVIPGFIVVDHELTTRVFSENVLINAGEASEVASILPEDTRIDNMIERTSQVMYEVTDHQGEHRIRLLGDSHSVPEADVFVAVRLTDMDELVRVFFGVPANLTPDLYHVLLSPLDLEPPRRALGHVLSPADGSGCAPWG